MEAARVASIAENPEAASDV